MLIRKRLNKYAAGVAALAITGASIVIAGAANIIDKAPLDDLWNNNGKVKLDTPDAKAHKGVKIAYYGFGQDNPWSQYMFEAVSAEAALYGAEATFVGPPSFNAQVEYQEISDATMSTRYKGMVIVPIDGATVAPAVEQAVAAGTKVVGVGFPVGGDTMSSKIQVPGMVGQVTENLKANAEAMADGVIKSCEGVDPCKVHVIWGARVLGFDKVKPANFYAMTNQHPNIKLVCETDGGYTQDLGRTQAADCLQANPELNVIASQADQMTRGAEASIVAAGRTFGLGKKDIKLVSAYASTYGVAQVRAGKWVQTSYNRPQGMGRAAVRLILLSLEGKTVPEYIPQEVLDDLPLILTKEVLDKNPKILGQFAG